MRKTYRKWRRGKIDKEKYMEGRKELKMLMEERRKKKKEEEKELRSLRNEQDV